MIDASISRTAAVRVPSRARGLALALLAGSSAFAAKSIYIPNFITSTGMDLNSSSSQWCYARSVQTDNWIIFWESGFGSDPSTASSTYKVNMATLEAVAEKSFTTYQDSLQMVVKDSSVANKYKQIIFLHYTTTWTATGSGQDEKVGTLDVNPDAANINTVAAHEIGHIFEYLTACDVPGSGWRWGFGTNGSGGNGYWEQMAQWEAFMAYPAAQFTDYDFDTYIQNNRLHILHEDPRYGNWFIGHWWYYKQGPHFQGKLWRSTKTYEDPVDTYKRITGVSQDSFNAEMYEHAARLTTWDLPAIKSYGANYIGSRAQVKMNQTSDGWWLTDTSSAPQNYGYNSIQLNAPAAKTTVLASFQGKAGASGFRSIKVDQAGWRYGFLALLKDGTRVYGDAASAKYANGANPTGTISFSVPDNCSKLWLIVSGSPQTYWHHPWNDDSSDDEQWAYQVQFANTNLLGQKNPTTSVLASNVVGNRLARTSGGLLRAADGVRDAEVRDLGGNLLAHLDANGLPLRSLPAGMLLVRGRIEGTGSSTSSAVFNPGK
jgi:hypothetical protein